MNPALSQASHGPSFDSRPVSAASTSSIACKGQVPHRLPQGLLQPKLGPEGGDVRSRCGAVRPRFARRPRRNYRTEKNSVSGACQEIPDYRVLYNSIIHAALRALDRVILIQGDDGSLLAPAQLGSRVRAV